MAEPTVTETTEVNETNNPVPEGAEQAESKNDELLNLKADYAKLKAALDKASKEAGDYRKQLRAKQSEDEIAAEEKKANDEAIQKELEELRREVARAHTTKSVMAALGTDEDASGRLSEYLYGAENIDAALAELKKHWAAKEKALRLEFGRIPAPGIGGANGEDLEAQKAINLAKELGRERAGDGKSTAESLRDYMR